MLGTKASSDAICFMRKGHEHGWQEEQPVLGSTGGRALARHSQPCREEREREGRGAWGRTLVPPGDMAVTRAEGGTASPSSKVSLTS